MIKCIDCSYLCSCDKASEYIKDCKDFKKISYNVKLTKVDGLNYTFEEVK